MSNVQQYIGDGLQRFTDEIFEFLRIPSVSTQSDHDADTRRAADWLRARMADAGLATEVIETPGHPIVLGEWREAGEDAPTILVYGHYDVQPADPLELWDSPPFEPEIRDGRIYARGSADDKGQMYLHVKAAEAHLKAGGGLPVNLIILAEGEEEVGSGNLIPFVEANTDRLACDAVVISDTGMFAPGVPSLLFSLRGLAYCEIHVDGPSSDLHSGYGGPIVNPAMALSRILATMFDEDGRIAIDGFYDDVVEWDDEIREGIRSLPFDEDEFAATMGARLIGGEQGYSVAERMWTRPTCEVNGMLSGYTGEGAKTVIPSTAMAKVSFRLVADQEPQRVYEQVRAHVAKFAPAGVTVRVEEDPFSGNPWRARITGKLKDAATAALMKAFGAAPVLAGEGGSIPIVSEFERILGAPCLLVGFALPGANEHAPNEWLPQENIEKGIRTLAYLYEELR